MLPVWKYPYGLFLEVPLKMFSLLMHCHVCPFQVLVGSRNIRMTRLITGYDDSFSVGQITDTGILQRVELVAVRKLQFCSDLIEVVPVHTGGHLLT